MAEQNQTGEQHPAAGEGTAQQGNAEAGLRAALEDERGKRQALEEQVRMFETQQLLYANNPPQGAQPQGQTVTAQEADELDGYEDDDVLTVGQFKRLRDREREGFRGAFEKGFSEIQLAVSTPDYHDVMNKYLAFALKENPWLIAAIKDKKNVHRYQTAYAMAKMTPEYQKDHQGQQTSDEGQGKPKGQQIIENAQKLTGAPAGAGGGLSQADYWANLPDDKFEEEIARVKSRG